MPDPYRPKKYVLGPDGSPLTIADLPPPGTTHWVIRRKAEVVAAVRGGLPSLDETCSRYALTVEEFLGWQRLIAEHGLAGLRTTRIDQYRRRVVSEPPIRSSCLSPEGGQASPDNESEPEGFAPAVIRPARRGRHLSAGPHRADRGSPRPRDTG